MKRNANLKIKYVEEYLVSWMNVMQPFGRAIASPEYHDDQRFLSLTILK